MLKDNFFLPVTTQDLKRLGWGGCDVILVTGDAYVDHPSFGAALLGRWLQSKGFRVGVISQPDWRSDADFMSLGRPSLFFGVTSGNMDSLVNHYTARKRIRSDDAYTPGGKTGKRPDRAVIVYTQALKRIFKNVPVVTGGIEASLRRIPHYDFWSDKLRNSILFDSKSDILVYGMAEKALLEIANAMRAGCGVEELVNVKGTVVKTSETSSKGVFLPEYEFGDPVNDFVVMSKIFYDNYRQREMFQKFRNKFLKHNPPSEPLTQSELDGLYRLPFLRRPHYKYGNKIIPAFEQIKLSITTHRGCFGGCNFCAISMHQGRVIQSRSPESISDEISTIASQDYFHGTLTDLGGPTANMYGMGCKSDSSICKRKSCLVPEICHHLNHDHSKLKEMLQKQNTKKNVKHIFVSSGIRHDLALLDKSYINLVSLRHVGGLMKVAPEHLSENTLRHMNKPSFTIYEKFVRTYFDCIKKINKKLSVVPYIIVGHPGSRPEDTVSLAMFLKKNNIKLEQVQEFTPTPMTVSTLMYYTQRDFDSGEKLYIPSMRETRLRKCLVQWYVRDNRKYIREFLKFAGRPDLISFFMSS